MEILSKKARSHLKRRVIPVWPLLSPRQLPALPPPARCLRWRETVRDVRSFLWSYLNVLDLPITAFNSTHPPSSAHRHSSIGSTVVGAPPLSPLLSREREDFISFRRTVLFFLFFCFGSRSVLLPPGCRCATRIDIDASVRAARRQVLTPRAHCVRRLPPPSMSVAFSPLRISSWGMERSCLI